MRFRQGLCIFLILTQLLPITSWAGDATTYRLLGGGVRNATLKQTIGLICTNETCTQAQFTLFEDENPIVQNLGDVFVIPTAPTERLQKKAMRYVIKTYFKDHLTEKQKSASGS